MLLGRVLWAAITADVLAQVIKVVLVLVMERKWAPGRLLETGGMPSSHSSAVAALATGVALERGLDSVEFAICAVFGAIIMYDATGIRRAAGLHARLLNELVEELGHLFREGFRPDSLKTLLGHTVPQVLVGALLGIGVAFAIVQ